MDFIKTKIHQHYKVIYAILLVLLAFICFFNLGKAPIQNWDESRHAANAYEMLKNNNYIANYYNGELDYWNLKPVLSYWCIMLFYKIFGFTTWGFRFYSALAYFAMVILISIFLKKQYGKTESLISIFMFLGCHRLLFTHMARTGDADALFCLFCTIAMIAMLMWKKNIKLTWLSAFCFSLAFLTKSWHAGIIVVVCVLYAIFSRTIKEMKLKDWIMIIIAGIIPILIWAIARYQFDGMNFFTQMFEYDLLKRSTEGIEGNGNHIFYYILTLGSDFTFVSSFLFIGLYLVKFLLEKKNIFQDDVIGLGLWVLIPTVLFTLVSTKLAWYIYPSCVALIIAGSIALGNLLKSDSLKKIQKIIIVVGILIIVFGIGFNILKVATIKEDNLLQNFIKEVLNLELISVDKYVYMQINENVMWPQSLIAFAELYGDLTCKNGGMDEFDKNNGSYIIMLKNSYNEEYQRYEKIYEKRKLILLRNNTERGDLK